MFDVSFSELLVIAVIALLVIGPEKLPKVARTIGALTGRIQRYVGQVKEEVSRELRFEELQKLQQEIKQSVESAQSNIQQQVAGIEHSITSQDETPSNSEALSTLELKSEVIIAPKPVRKTRAVKAKTIKSENVAQKMIAADAAPTVKVVKKTAKTSKKVEQ